MLLTPLPPTGVYVPGKASFGIRPPAAVCEPIWANHPLPTSQSTPISLVSTSPSGSCHRQIRSARIPSHLTTAHTSPATSRRGKTDNVPRGGERGLKPPIPPGRRRPASVASRSSAAFFSFAIIGSSPCSASAPRGRARGPDPLSYKLSSDKYLITLSTHNTYKCI